MPDKVLLPSNKNIVHNTVGGLSAEVAAPVFERVVFAYVVVVDAISVGVVILYSHVLVPGATVESASILLFQKHLNFCKKYFQFCKISLMPIQKSVHKKFNYLPRDPIVSLAWQ